MLRRQSFPADKLQRRSDPGGARSPERDPGRVVLSVEVRDLDAARIEAVFERIRARARAIAEARGTSIEFRDLEATAVPALTDRASSASSPVRRTGSG